MTRTVNRKLLVQIWILNRHKIVPTIQIYLQGKSELISKLILSFKIVNNFSKLPACCVPYEDYYLARFIDGNSPRVDNSFPPWMNHNLLKCGQKFAHNNWFSLGLAAALGRAANMNNLDIRDVAMFTGVMSTQAEGCEKILASFGAKLTVMLSNFHP